MPSPGPARLGFTDIDFERTFSASARRVAARGRDLPDGTPFRLPDDDPLEADRSDRRCAIRSCISRCRCASIGELDIDRDAGSDELVRHDVQERRHGRRRAGPTRTAEVAARARLLLASEVTDAYACAAGAGGRVPGGRAGRARPEFHSNRTHVHAADRLAAFTSELLGLLHQRGEALAGRVAATGRGAAAEFAEFLMLQAINRYEPVISHYADSGDLHPETLFQACLAAAGELATFTSTSKRPPRIPAYRHDHLRESFDPLIAALRESLSKVLTQSAISIPIEPKKHGFSVAIVTDRALYSTAAFILAARADVAAEELRRRFPSQLKIGPVEKISDLVRLGLPGVPVHALPAVPRQIPFHAGFAYFELDQTNDLWDQLKSSGGVAMHVAGEFPGLAMEFWAIRS